MDKRKEASDNQSELLDGRASKTTGKEAAKRVAGQASQQETPHSVDEFEPEHGVFAASPAIIEAAGLPESWETDFADEKAGKRKVSFYISPDTLHRLEDSQRQLKAMADREHRWSLSESRIVDAAVRMAMDELEKCGSESELARRLLKTSA